jgi:hypothetical protein
MYVFIPFGGFVLGLAVGRWWIVPAAVPLWAYIVQVDKLEGNLTIWVASTLSILLACAIACGVGLRKLVRRRLRAEL